MNERVDFLSGTTRRGVVVPREGLLGVLVTQHHLVLLHVLDLGILRDALFIVTVIFLDSLGEEGCHHLFLLQLFPVHFLEERMLAHFFDACSA